MKYIKDCPQCGKKVRFPLDRGKIKIVCQCGHTTVIDPDDKNLYNSGSFDIKPESGKSGSETNPASLLLAFFKSISWANIVNSLLEAKYKVQNFRYMPDREKYRLLFITILVVLLVSAVAYYL